MSDFYVYAHRTLTPRRMGDVFYIGKGRAKRAWSKKGRSAYWKRTVEKYGYAVDILADGLSEQAAFDLEKSFIAVCGRKSLCNMTDGGEGSSGYVPSDEARAKISAGNKGRSPSDTHRQKISAAKKGHAVSASTRAKIGAASKGRLPSAEHVLKMSKPVLCSNGMRFVSVSDATRWLRNNGFPKASKGNVAQRCAGRYVTAYGFTWSYE